MTFLGAPDDAAEELRDTLDRACRFSPFFSGLLDTAGIGVKELQTLDDLTRFPLTTKEQLRAAYPAGWTAVPEEDVVRIHASSGTTGRRTICGYTTRDLDDWIGMFARCLRYAGITETDRFQVMAGYGLWTAGWGFQAAVERVGAMAVPAGPGNPDLQFELMRDLGTTAIGATASFATVLAERARTGGHRDALRLRVGVFGAERWSERTRERIRALLGLDAYDLWGLTELWGPGTGVECHRHDGMHVWTDHFLVEVIDPVTLQPVPHGEQGEIVVTTLRKEATPLLRYRTRDLSYLYPEPCPCGSPYPRIGRLMGRTDDAVKVRGVLFFPAQIEHVVTSVDGGTGEYDIHLTGDTAGVEGLRIRVEAPDSNGLAADLARRLRAEIGLRADVEVLAPGTLPRSERKTRRVYDHRDP